MDPVHIFPEEVWRIIFRHLDHKDRVNCMNTCSTWKSWLNPQQLLFPEVLAQLMNVLPKNDLINCRKVRKSWKRNVDEVYENHPLHVSTSQMSLARELQWKHDGIRFSSTSQIERFLTTMKSDSGNPFPGRCVELYDHLCNTPAYWLNVRKLLERYGEHIWYAYIKYNFRTSNPAAIGVEETLGDCLVLLPNVKKLYLDADLDTYIIDTEGVYERISTYFKLKPMKSFKQLEVLSFSDSWPSPLHLEIIRCSSSTLKKLDFCNYVYDGSIPLENLEEAHTMVENIEDFDKIELFPSTMKKISIKTAYNGKPLPFELVFKKFERFSESLKELCLEMKLSTINNRYKPNLPRLEKITISVKGPLNYLLKLKGLKYLKIFNYKSRQWKNKRVLVYGVENMMCDSNIWDFMPSLDTLEFQGISSRGKFDNTFKRKCT